MIRLFRTVNRLHRELRAQRRVLLAATRDNTAAAQRIRRVHERIGRPVANRHCAPSTDTKPGKVC